MPLDPQLDPHFDEAARLNNLDPQLLRAMASGESDFDPNATSKKNAGGLMQIIPETAQHYGIKDPYDPVQAIYGAARILNDNLTNAEAAKAAGANIVPVDEALRSYFAGSGGGNRGPLTEKYPGYIASKYSELQKGAGVASTLSPIDQLAAARGPMPTPGAVATNVQPPPGTPDTLDAAPTPIAQLAALSGLGTSPSIPDRSAGGMVAPPGAGRVSPSEGVDRLANASPTPLVPGLTQVAQAGVPSDADLLKMLDAVAPAKATGAVSPTSSATVPPPLSAPPGQQVNPAAIAESIAKIDRNNMLHLPSNPYDVERVKLAPGLSGDPQQQWRLKQAETLAAHSQQIGPAGVENMPNSVQADAERAAGIAEAQQAPVRKTQGERPAEQRGAGSSVTYPPGSTGAQPWIDAKAAGKQTPAGVRINDDGSVEVGNINVPPEVVHQRYEALAKLADEAEAARTGQFESGLLRQKLIDIGTSGPITEQLGKLSALATQWGVPQKTIDSFNIPKAATVEQANKLSIDLLGSILHQRYPQRITNNDIVITKPSVAGANNMLEASLFMLDQVANPSFQRAIERYGHMAGISAQDPQLTSYYKELDNWNNAHSFGSYAKSFKPGMYSEAAPATTPAAAPSQSGPAVAVPSQQPPVPGATMGADGNWHVTIGGKSHTLVPPKP
jgi:hypothetical protein